MVSLKFNPLTLLAQGDMPFVAQGIPFRKFFHKTNAEWILVW